jgi:hypothetical protein
MRFGAGLYDSLLGAFSPFAHLTLTLKSIYVTGRP